MNALLDRDAPEESWLLERCAAQIAREAGTRGLVFVPGARTGGLPADELAALLLQIRQASADALLVVGTPTPNVESLPRFERLAGAAGWEHCQLWCDAHGRFALHVLEPMRTADGA
ncbi:MAG: L-histidine N(alpha)-methyltransferase [Burkholderiales bacterium]|nr:L-histidine N(alpha)-methyltransferase [Burkholderiales bacterium]